MGYAGMDPVIVFFAGEKKMGRISLGVHEYYKNSVGDTVDQTQWFNLIFWNDRVDLISERVKKGSPLNIEGKLSSQSYTDKHGEQRHGVEIIVYEMEVLERSQL